MEIIDKILEADFANIAKKVASGKPLTEAERKLVNERKATAHKPKKQAPTGKLGTAPNIRAAAGRLEFPVELLKDARNSGCDAFQSSGRVNCDRFVQWIAENPEFSKKWDQGLCSKTYEDALKARADRLIREHKLAELKKLAIPRAEMGARLRVLATRQKEIAERFFASDPKTLDEFCGLMRDMVKEWGE